MTAFVYRNGRLIEKSKAPPLNVPFGRSANVITDEMPASKHMGTGKMITSKREFRAHTRAIGAVEVGTDPAVSRPGRPPPPPSLEPYVQRAIAMCESGYRPRINGR